MRSLPEESRPIVFCVALAVAIVAAYANSLHAPFVFDDRQAIIDNPSVHTLWPLWVPLSPPDHTTGAIGRPLVNLSLAVNYAVGGKNVTGYHVVNLLIHLAAALALFGIGRRTLLRLEGGGLRESATLIAFGVALLWALHPLQTESVTCVIQRSESLLGLFHLTTLYCFIRATGPHASSGWPVASVLACAAGMATKEVMVSAPLVVLLYDRTFVAGTFREAWRKRWRMHAALGATWLLLAWLVAGHDQRSGSAGFGLGVTWWEYLLTQCRAIVLYLRLSVWPHPLVLDYGRELVREFSAVWLQAGFLTALFLATMWALWRRPAWGFVGFWFFALLAPSSSVVPLVTQTMAEHRMYLPLVAVIVAGVAVGYRLLGRRAAWIAVVAALVAGGFTIHRNRAYRTEVSIWQDTVAKRPDNARARYNLGTALDQAGRSDDALTEFRAAVRLDPDYSDAHYNLGNVLARQGRYAEALPSFEAAVRTRPEFVDARLNLGNTLMSLGLFPEAIATFRAITAMQSDWPPAHRNLGDALQRFRRYDEAVAEFRAWAALAPDDPAAHYYLGNALALAERWDEAAAAYRETLVLEPRRPHAHTNLGGALLALGRHREAIAVLERALELDPDDVLAQDNLRRARAGRDAESKP